MKKSYYDILEIGEIASLTTIKNAYRKLKKEAETISDSEKKQKKLKKLEKAYKILSNPIEKEKYDLSMKQAKEEPKNDDHSSEKKDKNRSIKTVGIVVGTIALLIGLFFLSELSNSSSNTPQKPLTNITYSEFKELVSGSTRTVVMVGRPDCSWCQKLRPLMQKVANKYNVDIKYLNVNNFTEEDYNDFTKLDTASSPSSKGGTPMTFIIANGKIEARLDGYVEQDKLETFLMSNKIIF